MDSQPTSAMQTKIFKQLGFDAQFLNAKDEVLKTMFDGNQKSFLWKTSSGNLMSTMMVGDGCFGIGGLDGTEIEFPFIESFPKTEVNGNAKIKQILD